MQWRAHRPVPVVIDIEANIRDTHEHLDVAMLANKPNEGEEHRGTFWFPLRECVTV